MKPKPAGRLDLPAIFGVLDAAVGFAFAAHAPVAIWYSITITVKLLSTFLLRRPNNLRPLDATLLTSFVVLGLLTLMTGEQTRPENYLQFGAFVSSLGLTFLLIGPASLRDYLRSAFLTLSATAAFHIAWAKTGHEDSNFGRYYFFAQQPNLGAENAAIASVIGLYGPKRRLYWFSWVILISDALLVQGRAALLTMVPALLTSICFNDRGRLEKQRLIVGSFLAFLGAPLLFLLVTSDALHQGVSTSLALNSQSRGLRSGFSGRDQLWAQALDYFNSSPFLGHSLSRFGDDNYAGSHNYIFYGLAQFGLPFLAILATLAAGYISAARKNAASLITLLCATPLLLFNDRLVNLNAYPFLFYVLALKIGSSHASTFNHKRRSTQITDRYASIRGLH